MRKPDLELADFARYGCTEPAQPQQAEKELGAFYTAVLEVYGPAQAARAADDWLSQLEVSRESTPWRAISIAAADKLAGRVLSESRFALRQGNVSLLRGRIDQMLHSMCPCTAK